MNSFIEADSNEIEKFWIKIDDVLKRKRLAWVRTPLLEDLQRSLGDIRRGASWLKVERSPESMTEWLLRVRNVVFSLLALGLLSPPMLCVASLIKLTSPGPILYKAVVVGQNGKKFVWRKFRSMTVVSDKYDTERRWKQFRTYVTSGETGSSENTPMKVIDEKRVTTVGHFIRKFSIDEIPQLWNVLQGDMSLVGPRPCLPYEAEFYTGWRRRRFMVHPGLTGVWQVFGRGKVDFDKSAAMDVYYLYRRSFGFDLYLILKTLVAVLTGKGAR